jgi:hypothetical protein
VHSLPSSSSHCSLPSFPIDDYVPALFPYWRLCSRPLSPLTIMFLLPFPIFDYVPSPFPYFRLCSFSLSLFSIMSLTLSVPDVLMLLLQDCWKCNLCIKYLSKQTGQLLSMHKIMFQSSTLFLMSARALLNNGCSSPQKDECSRPLK